MDVHRIRRGRDDILLSSRQDVFFQNVDEHVGMFHVMASLGVFVFECVNFIASPRTVIPACFQRWFGEAHHRRVRIWTPDKNIRG